MKKKKKIVKYSYLYKYKACCNIVGLQIMIWKGEIKREKQIEKEREIEKERKIDRKRKVMNIEVD